MKIKNVEFNNRRKVFTVETANESFDFPYSKAEPMPVRGNYTKSAFIDKELGNEAFTYTLESGEEGSIHLDSVLEYNEDPDYMNDLLMYNLSLALKEAMEKSPISKREIIKRLDTSPAQLYRIIEPKASGKSLSQIFKLLYFLDYDLELVIKNKQTGKRGSSFPKDQLSVSARSMKPAAVEQNA